MNESKMDELLVGALREYGLGLADKAIEKAVKRLPTEAVSRVVEVEGLAPLKLRDALVLVGKVLEESDDCRTYVVMVGAGVAKANPAIVAIILDEKRVMMKAYAKEGLIKQHTAEKALDAIEEELLKAERRI